MTRHSTAGNTEDSFIVDALSQERRLLVVALAASLRAQRGFTVGIAKPSRLMGQPTSLDNLYGILVVVGNGVQLGWLLNHANIPAGLFNDLPMNVNLAAGLLSSEMGLTNLDRLVKYAQECDRRADERTMSMASQLDKLTPVERMRLYEGRYDVVTDDE